jgi:hypothetical protein
MGSARISGRALTLPLADARGFTAHQHVDMIGLTLDGKQVLPQRREAVRPFAASPGTRAMPLPQRDKKRERLSVRNGLPLPLLPQC